MVGMRIRQPDDGVYWPFAVKRFYTIIAKVQWGIGKGIDCLQTLMHLIASCSQFGQEEEVWRFCADDMHDLFTLCCNIIS